MGGAVPVEVLAMGGGDVLRGRTGPEGPDDLTTAVVRYDNGAVVSYTVCYALPAEFPTQGQSVRIELIGSDGYLVLHARRRILEGEVGERIEPVRSLPDHVPQRVVHGTRIGGRVHRRRRVPEEERAHREDMPVDAVVVHPLQPSGERLREVRPREHRVRPTAGGSEPPLRGEPEIHPV